VSNLALLQCHVAGVCLINEREGGKQRGTLKNWYPTTTFHSTTTQKTIDSIFTAMETSNLTSAWFTLHCVYIDRRQVSCVETTNFYDIPPGFIAHSCCNEFLCTYHILLLVLIFQFRFIALVFFFFFWQTRVAAMKLFHVMKDVTYFWASRGFFSLLQQWGALVLLLLCLCSCLFT
jgi:hypothetical protein